MSHIPDSHPRAASLRRRERIVAGVRAGLTSEAGLIAHGRGEAFDYLLGETTHPFAQEAIHAAAAALLRAKHPVVSINGNVAALAADDLQKLEASAPELRFEVNLFHWSEERVTRILDHLRRCGMTRVLGDIDRDHVRLETLQSARSRMDVDGIAKADVVLVPLEDGDRCEALRASGREVITIDLNPMSRTARKASITIVDELLRVLPKLGVAMDALRKCRQDELEQLLRSYDNASILARAEAAIRGG